jgi:hypothetical protein
MYEFFPRGCRHDCLSQWVAILGDWVRVVEAWVSALNWILMRLLFV